jgi:hypothetical protein
MPNMKLLDSQTGKYLELGEDWLYGGEDIIVNKCSIGYKIYEAIQHKDSEKFFMYDEDCPFTDELQEPLKTLCENTGAVVYGGRYVLLESEGCGNVYSVENKRCGDSFYDIVDNEGLFRETHYNNDEITSIGNIFEEYSKQLRNEPNKFEELLELIK